MVFASSPGRFKQKHVQAHTSHKLAIKPSLSTPLLPCSHLKPTVSLLITLSFALPNPPSALRSLVRSAPLDTTKRNTCSLHTYIFIYSVTFKVHSQPKSRGNFSVANIYIFNARRSSHMEPLICSLILVLTQTVPTQCAAAPHLSNFNQYTS
jgi:hypothetical protein